MSRESSRHAVLFPSRMAMSNEPPDGPFLRLLVRFRSRSSMHPRLVHDRRSHDARWTGRRSHGHLSRMANIRDFVRARGGICGARDLADELGVGVARARDFAWDNDLPKVGNAFAFRPGD